ncbi:MAG TPA: radical SAM protein [Deltaproteobacteria bacterium]|nr:radical SAM protein [Deltaproteobacteria bacterium]
MVSKTRTSRNEFIETEVGTIRKNWNGRIRIALAYPNRYHVGMSNLGFQTVYRAFNAFEHVVCERVFIQEPDESAARGPRSLESDRRLSDFDIIAFSISFENDYINLLTLLKQAGLPLRSKDRSPTHPLVIAGGVACLLNPEPIAPFMDCFLIGESEPLIPRFMEAFDPSKEKQLLLKELVREIQGIYVPAFYEIRYDKNGILSSFHPLADAPDTIQPMALKDSPVKPAFSCLLTPHAAFDDTYLIEVGRGCPHGCRFCAAGYIYRPPRFRPLTDLKQCIDAGSAQTRKVGLVGAAVSDHPDIGNLCRFVDGKDIQLSFSSLRADALTPELLTALKQSGVKTATIAPDAGSERMRRVINKGLTEEHILQAAENLVAYGIPNLRLYFMVGLPTETTEDLEAVVVLCKQLKHRFLQSSRARKRMGEITVGLNSFVPKPFTPFQWSAMDEVSSLKKKIKTVKTALNRVPNVRVYSDIPRWAYVQGFLSRGDRRTAELLVQAHDNNENWAKTLKASPINADFYVYRERSTSENLPWDFIDHGIKKSFLKREYRRALEGKTTDLCKPDTCNICGVCKQTNGSITPNEG